MPPADYQRARSAASSSSDTPGDPSSSPYLHSTVRGRPYLPNLNVEASSSPHGDDDDGSSSASSSAARAAVAVTLAGMGRAPSEIADAASRNGPDEKLGVGRVSRGIEVMKVSGGITNALFRVSGLLSVVSAENCAENGTAENGTAGNGAGCPHGRRGPIEDSVLVRVFGAEGMIDRDVETSTYAALCDSGVAHSYIGRFGNGRIEGWLDGYTTLHKSDLSDPSTSDAIAVEMAKLHHGFEVPEELREWHDPDKPAMWTQLHSWMDQASGYDKFKTPQDDVRAAALDLPKIRSQLAWLEEEVVPSDARVAFCHNDLLAANIMMHPTTGKIQLIDFEYGGVNYVAFDVANHFNEHAGGTDEEDNGVPDYGLFPSERRQREFVTAYVRAARGDKEGGDEEVEEEVESLLGEVRAFVLANHLYWGLWAVNQAAMEGCKDFDYLTYAKNRFDEYYRAKGEEGEDGGGGASVRL